MMGSMMGSMIPLGGFAPDLDPATPGVLTDCNGFFPTARGMAAAPTLASSGYAALDAKCQGSSRLVLLDRSNRLFAGTTTKLYQGASFTWTDRSRAAGGAYNGGADTRWRFAQFGSASLACQKGDLLQRSTSGAFADVAGSPKANLMDVGNGFVMLGDTSDAGFGDSPDRWWCSALNDETSWTPSVATQAASGRLVDSPGALRAMKRLGNAFVAYKDTALWIGQYVGPPVIWQWTKIAGEIGTHCQEAVINIGPAHLFVGRDDIWMFDGSRPVSLGAPLREWFFADLDIAFAYRLIGVHDSKNGLAIWFYPNRSAAGVLSSAIAFNYRTQKWGRASYSIEYAGDSQSDAITIDGLDSVASTIDALPSVPLDAPFWSSSTPLIMAFDTSHVMQTLTGAAASASITTGDYGDDETFQLLQRVRPHFTRKPTTAVLTNYYKADPGGDRTEDQTVNIVSNRFDILRSSRWHALRFATVGDCEMTGFTPTLSPDGSE